MTTVDEDTLIQALHERGMRVTPQRVLIHRALRDVGRHVTAEQVLDSVAVSLPNASLPTVYAALELFEELGIVRRLAAGTGASLWDPRTDEHHHLVCSRCGAVEDVDAPLDVAPVVRAARRRGYRPAAAELVLTGLCAGCSATEASHQRSSRSTKARGRSA
jgi:Fe2+ or Zn2+ uptake regulation protein